MAGIGKLLRKLLTSSPKKEKAKSTSRILDELREDPWDPANRPSAKTLADYVSKAGQDNRKLLDDMTDKEKLKLFKKLREEEKPKMQRQDVLPRTEDELEEALKSLQMQKRADEGSFNDSLEVLMKKTKSTPDPDEAAILEDLLEEQLEEAYSRSVKK
jgi:hypothetical protein